MKFCQLALNLIFALLTSAVPADFSLVSVTN